MDNFSLVNYLRQFAGSNTLCVVPHEATFILSNENHDHSRITCTCDYSFLMGHYASHSFQRPINPDSVQSIVDKKMSEYTKNKIISFEDNNIHLEIQPVESWFVFRVLDGQHRLAAAYKLYDMFKGIKISFVVRFYTFKTDNERFETFRDINSGVALHPCYKDINVFENTCADQTIEVLKEMWRYVENDVCKFVIVMEGARKPRSISLNAITEFAYIIAHEMRGDTIDMEKFKEIIRQHLLNINILLMHYTPPNWKKDVSESTVKKARELGIPLVLIKNTTEFDAVFKVYIGTIYRQASDV